MRSTRYSCVTETSAGLCRADCSCTRCGFASYNGEPVLRFARDEAAATVEEEEDAGSGKMAPCGLRFRRAACMS